jgi:hypothetical protein
MPCIATGDHEPIKIGAVGEIDLSDGTAKAVSFCGEDVEKVVLNLTPEEVTGHHSKGLVEFGGIYGTESDGDLATSCFVDSATG